MYAVHRDHYGVAGAHRPGFAAHRHRPGALENVIDFLGFSMEMRSDRLSRFESFLCQAALLDGGRRPVDQGTYFGAMSSTDDLSIVYVYDLHGGGYSTDPERRMKQITIVCDGSSLGNGGTAAKAGAAAILSYVDGNGSRHVKALGEYLGKATNNQAEIVAACIALEALKQPCVASVVTDSTYVVETQKGNYRRKKNHEFWERLDRAADGHRVTWSWTRGHAGHDVQERCDKLARVIAEAGGIEDAMLAEALKGL